ncbi:MAG TPA: LuxR C-terminal-related transcriptional regulator [Methylomusa anaerophila]|uniref:Acetoin dehydrogenase operon transcriptional activator AcoR n=1 Tax=Methylomusa anaerophila TaxID=1930071 RepID=A0A348AGI7_9FIRM|nr:LuxR C-terminal-related transcriptional regulator [Methylomusa anaerophila]BBB90185.1 acetoin dehydrogenase operon transcriptional activator AcoR [Methylomusa anaerophila]HML88089.1 LuxR C-terminal-related transcriptional regulator [Methylomusa anaerophila]
MDNSVKKANRLEITNRFIHPKKVLPEQELQELLKHNELLISVSKPILRKILDSCISMGNLLMLCDSQGYITNLSGDLEIIQWLFERGFKLGTCMDYESSGLNAVSLAIQTKQLSEVKGRLHHCVSLRKWSSVAAPIQFQGNIVAMINLMTPLAVETTESKVIVQLLSDYISIHLEKCEKSYDSIAKNVFYGTLILNTDLNLTIKEIDIIYRLYQGEKLAELPTKMSLSPNTIKSHVKSIYSKFGVNKLIDCLDAVQLIFEKANEIN